MVGFEVKNGAWGPGLVKFPLLVVGSPWLPRCIYCTAGYTQRCVFRAGLLARSKFPSPRQRGAQTRGEICSQLFVEDPEGEILLPGSRLVSEAPEV